MNKQKNNENQGYFFIIPTVLVEQGDHIKALLYGLISSLVSKEGYCWASNKYLAEKLGRKDCSVISTKIAELENDGWVISEVDKQAGNQRKIWISNPTPIRKKPKTSLEKTKDLIGKNQRGSLEKTKEGHWKKPKTSLEISKDSNIKEKYKEKDNNNKRAEARQDIQILESEIEPKHSSTDPVNQVFEVFYKTINPAINYGNKGTRSAAEWLVKKYGLEKTIAMAKFACEIQGQPYSPTITTPYQLKENLGKLVVYAQKQSNKPQSGVLKI